VTAGFAEHLHHQVGGTVDDLGLLAEVFGAVDKAHQLHASHYPVEVAAQSVLQARQHIQSGQAGVVLALLQIEFAPELAKASALAVLARHLARDEGEVASDDATDVIAGRFEFTGQHDAEFGKATVYASGHGKFPF
jgi:acetyl-CoA acetyltransferase